MTAIGFLLYTDKTEMTVGKIVLWGWHPFEGKMPLTEFAS